MTDIDIEQLSAAITLSRRPGIGAHRFKNFLARHGTPSRALAAFDAQLDLFEDSTESTTKAALEELTQRALFEIGRFEIGATWYGADDYPTCLAAISEPPPYLFHEGPLWPLPPTCVAIVGSRRSTIEGLVAASKIARWLAARGLLVVSGGALGIDGAAHRATLEADGGPVLVTATGIDRVYPPSHADLFRQVRRRGCLLTELLPGTPPRRDFFPTRNRIIVGLSSVVVVIEGRCESGTASTALHARRAGRPIFAWNESPDCELRELPARLIAEGATPLDLSSPEGVLAAMSG